MPIDRELILKNGWGQGRLFSLDDSRRLFEEAAPRPFLPAHPEGVPDGCRLLIASHDCDVASPRDEEPHVDVYPALPLPNALQSDMQAARNPRRLHLHIIVDGRKFLLSYLRLHGLRSNAKY